MEEKLVAVIDEMADVLSVSQLKKLQEVMLKHFVKRGVDTQTITNEEYLRHFLEAKEIEGCSSRTIHYYKTTIEHLLNNIEKLVNFS